MANWTSNREHADSYFQRSVFPILTPLGVVPDSRFLHQQLEHLPRGSGQKPNFELNLRPRQDPPKPPRWRHGDPAVFVPIEKSSPPSLLFPGVEVIESCPFRVTATRTSAQRGRGGRLDRPDREELRYRKFLRWSAWKSAIGFRCPGEMAHGRAGERPMFISQRAAQSDRPDGSV